jgi:DNA-binding transcriptional ArsR family regulator
MENETQLDAVFGALSDRRRRKMLASLAEAPKGVGELAASAGLKASAASKHIAQLEDAGLVLKSRRGREIVCHMNYDVWKIVAGFVAMHAEFWAGRLAELNEYLKGVGRE